MRPGLPRPARSLAAAVLLALAGTPAAAQPEVRLSGLAYLDYYAQITSPDSSREGRHGFTYRRLYLTADARLSDAFTARARLEAGDGSLGSRGSVPFVKDLYLRWTSRGDYRLTFGITPPPAHDLTDDVWGYRSLEKTLLDLNGVLASRDLGLRADGPIPLGRDGLLRFGVMVANGNGVFPEDDQQKRLYAQVQARPTEALVLALGGSVGSHADSLPRHSGERATDRSLFALAGYVTDTWRLGVEGYLRNSGFDDGAVSLSGAGVSVFGAVQVAPAVTVVGRFDRARTDRLASTDPPVSSPPFSTDFTSFALFGLSYAPIEYARLTPNLRWARTDGASEADLQGRLTVDFTF